jgi:hypothetical protein
MFAAIRALVALVSFPFIHRVVNMGRNVAKRFGGTGPRRQDGPRRAALGVVAVPASRSRTTSAGSLPRVRARSAARLAHTSPSTARSGEAMPPPRPARVDDQRGAGARMDAILPVGDVYRIAPPALRYVDVSPPSLVALNTRSRRRIEARFAEKVCLSAGPGIYASHCKGAACDGGDLICGCPCLSCDWRRALYEQATIEIVGHRVVVAHVPAHAASVHERIVRQWHALQSACETAGTPALHCNGSACQETVDRTLCECDCDACRRAVGLLVQAERDVVGEAESR